MKKAYIAVFASVALFCAVLAMIFIRGRVPTKEEVDTLVQQLQREQDYSRRVELAGDLLDILRTTMVHALREIEGYTFVRLEEYFLEERDEAILEAMDRTYMHGGFANLVSDLYYGFRNEPEFVRRYRENDSARDALKRCIGLAWSYEEYYSLLYSGDDTTEIDEEIALEIAEGPALELGYNPRKSTVTCEKVGNEFTVTYFSQSNPEKEDVSVLIDSRNANVIAVTDLREPST